MYSWTPRRFPMCLDRFQRRGVRKANPKKATMSNIFSIVANPDFENGTWSVKGRTWLNVGQDVTRSRHLRIARYPSFHRQACVTPRLMLSHNPYGSRTGKIFA